MEQQNKVTSILNTVTTVALLATVIFLLLLIKQCNDNYISILETPDNQPKIDSLTQVVANLDGTLTKYKADIAVLNDTIMIYKGTLAVNQEKINTLRKARKVTQVKILNDAEIAEFVRTNYACIMDTLKRTAPVVQIPKAVTNQLINDVKLNSIYVEEIFLLDSSLNICNQITAQQDSLVKMYEIVNDTLTQGFVTLQAINNEQKLQITSLKDINQKQAKKYTRLERIVYIAGGAIIGAFLIRDAQK